MHPTKRSCIFYIVVFALAFAAFSTRGASAAPSEQDQEEPKAEIFAPGGGDALQGVVTITGTSAVTGFRSAEVSFAYQNDPTGTWFLLQQVSQPVKEGSLASWDTTTITDGDYRLRLKVFLDGGGMQEFVVGGLRVRNYTRVETSTPQAGIRVVTPTFTASPLPDFAVTPRVPTPAPTNPAEVSMEAMRGSIFRGALAVTGAMALGIIYTGMRAMFRRRR